MILGTALPKSLAKSKVVHPPEEMGKLGDPDGETLTPVHGNKVLLVEEPLELLCVNLLDDRLGLLVASLGPGLVRFRLRCGVHGGQEGA